LQQTGDISQLAAQHSSLDSQLSQLSQKRFLSPQEEMEERQLKKMKLSLKDAISAAQRSGQPPGNA